MPLLPDELATALVKEFMRIQRRHPRLILVLFPFFTTGFAALLLANFKGGNPLWANLQLLLHSKNAIPLLLSGLAVAAFFAFSITYLDRSLTSDRNSVEDARLERMLLRNLAFKIGKEQKGSSVGYEELRLRLLGDTSFHERLAGEEKLAAKLCEVVGTRVSDELAAKTEHLSKIKLVDSVFAETDGRLKGEIVALTRRANFNLAIGSTVTAGALLALIFMLFNVPVGLTTTREAVVYFIPRLSTTTFVEVFAFFFLRLYKSSLDEVSNYQKLLTDLAKFRAATTSSYLVGNEAGHLVVLNGLCSSEQKASEIAAAPPINNDLLKQVLDLAQLIVKASGKPA